MDNTSFAYRKKRARASPQSQQKCLDAFTNVTSMGRGRRRQSITKNQYEDRTATPSTMSLDSDDDQSIHLSDMFDLESDHSEPEAESTSVSLSHKSYIEIPMGFSPVPTRRKSQTMQNTTSTIDICEGDEEGSVGILFDSHNRDDDDGSICWDVLESDSDSDSSSTSTSTSSSSSSYPLLSSSPSLSSQESSSDELDCEVLDDEIFGEFFKDREDLLRQPKTTSAFGNRSRGTKNKKSETAWKQSRDNSDMKVSFSRLESEVIDDVLALKTHRMILRDYHYKIDIHHDCEQPLENETNDKSANNRKQLVRARDNFNDYSVPLDSSKDNTGKTLRKFTRTPYLGNKDTDDEESISVAGSEPSLELFDLKHDEEFIDIGDYEDDYEDEDEEDERPKDIFWGLVYSLGGMALVGAVGGIAKYVSKIIGKSGGGDEGNHLIHQISEVTEWSVELMDASASFSGSFGGSGVITGSGAANITTTTASASMSGSGACAASSVGLSTSTSALGTSAAAAVATEATAMAATQAAVVQGMTISAASTASGAVAGATTAAGIAVAGTTSITATTAIVATTATAGVLAVASGATTGYLPEMVAFNATAVPVPTCPEIPVSAMSRIKISFSRDSDSLAADLIEGNGDWSQLGSQILENYNDISGGCYELYQRSMINCSYDFSEYNENTDVIDTYWTSYVACNNSCPVDNPLFGIDNIGSWDPDIVGQDIVARMLKPVPETSSPTAAPTTFPSVAPSTEQSEAPSSAPSGAPTDRPKIPISREDFLQSIQAKSVEPSTRIVFDHPTASPTTISESPSAAPAAIPTASVSSTPSNMPSPSLSSHPTHSPNNSPTIIPSSSPSTIPSSEPSASPSDSLSSYPSAVPSFNPSNSPSDLPSIVPSAVPTIIPSGEPSYRPSESPTKQPSGSPSYSPSSDLSDMPSPLVSAVPTTMPSIPSTMALEGPSSLIPVLRDILAKIHRSYTSTLGN